MAKLTSDVSNPLKMRIPTIGGRGKSPFLQDWRYPSPTKGFGKRRGKKK